MLDNAIIAGILQQIASCNSLQHANQVISDKMKWNCFTTGRPHELQHVPIDKDFKTYIDIKQKSNNLPAP